MDLIEVKVNKNANTSERYEILGVDRLSTDQEWQLNKPYINASFVYAANEILEKGIRKGYKLRLDFKTIPPIGRTIVTKIVGDKGYIESYHGQKYIALVRIIDLR